MGLNNVRINDQNVTIRLNLEVHSRAGGAGAPATQSVEVKEFEIDTIENDAVTSTIRLATLNWGSAHYLRELIPNDTNLSTKQTLWAPRGDNYSATRCFIATKNSVPAAYFNLGTSVITVDYQSSTFIPNECGAFNRTLSSDEFAQISYAVRVYMDSLYELNPTLLSKFVIYTTKDANTAKALEDGGWSKPQQGDEFFDALINVAPEAADNRPKRFNVSEEGHFMERCRIVTDEEWHYGYEEKDLFVHVLGAEGAE